MPITRRTLRRFDLFRSVDDAGLAELGQYIQEADYPAGSVIFADGESADCLYLLRSGTVQFVKAMPHGEVLLNEMRAPGVFGEMAVLDDQPRSAGARAATKATVLKIPKADFLSLLQRYPLVLHEMTSVGGDRLRQRDQALIAELLAHNRQLQKLYETSLDISRHLELSMALAAIVERAESLLNGSEGLLHLYDPERNQLVALPTASHPSAAGLEVKPGDGTIGKAFAGAEPLTRGHTSRRPQAPVALAVPVTLDSRPIGVLSVYRPPHADLFNADDAQLLSLFANQAAVAIENARLYGLAVDKGRMDGELQAARRVQSSFIPTEPPRIPGFQLAGMWRPARQVAGDFYDYFPLRKDEWGIVMADVSDKGMPAALFMAEARSILRASAALEMDPAKVLEHANRVLTADSSSGMFVTLVFGILQARSRDFTWANGGHNLPLLWRNKEPKLQELRLPGLALGIDPDYHYKSARVSLEPQDVLVLYTDGITEAVDEQNEFLGLEPLARFIEGSAGARSAQEIVRAIDSGVNAFIGKQALLDDATLLVIRAGGRKTGLD